MNIAGGSNSSGLQGMLTEDGVNLVTVGDKENESLAASFRSGEEPVDMFRPTEGPRTSKAKKSHIYVEPIDIQDYYNDVCFKLIGAGSVFCTASNCTVAHHGGMTMTVNNGDIFVTNSSMEAFPEPQMSSFLTTTNKPFKTGWMLLSEKFLMASAAGDDKPASSATMEAQEDFYHNKALTFKMPAKRKRTLEEDMLDLVTAVPYSPFSLFKDDKDLVLGYLSKFSGLLSRFDQSFLNMNEALISFLDDYKQQSDKASIAISSLRF